MQRIILFFTLFLYFQSFSFAQHSVARQWNEVLLESIRNDFARPPVHARNLFHLSAAMYDAWAVFEEDHQTYFLGKEIDGFPFPFDGMPMPADIRASQEEAISYAAFRLLQHRFKKSPGFSESDQLMRDLFAELNYDTTFNSRDYSTGSAAALGNYLAFKIIEFGFQDGANEVNDYANQYYFPVNFPFLPEDPGNGIPESPGNGFFRFPNRWQPIAFSVFIDQAGNPIPDEAPAFQSPEWGNVIPFSLQEEDAVVYERFGFPYKVFHDPGEPCLINVDQPDASSDEYMWGFSLVSIWGAHLDPNDGVMWDISPASIGNVQDFPTTIPGLRDFYDLLEGGDPSPGHELNPHTGQPYEPQIVPRADYARVLAEFWADGPDSETPPGHWFTILNYVSDHPELEKRFKGEGEILDDLEWDVKAYFTLGGAMHDAAIAAWSIKGWYDYVRPISAIRSMAVRGQSSDPNELSYHQAGIPLVEGYIEIVKPGDPLAGRDNENVGKIKLYTWRSPEYIDNPETDAAGVGWILGENWWPFQRPTFITPPFAGYVSGHSTFSRAAAEVLTLVTGDPFFPGGMGTFLAKKNEFLVFEEGPSVDIELQWATYRDASDQTSLSRIWGGIHPPVDDIPGRLIGREVGIDAFQYAESYFASELTDVDDPFPTASTWVNISPNPVRQSGNLFIELLQPQAPATISIFNINGSRVKQLETYGSVSLSVADLPAGSYFVKVVSRQIESTEKIIIIND